MGLPQTWEAQRWPQPTLGLRDEERGYPKTGGLRHDLNTLMGMEDEAMWHRRGLPQVWGPQGLPQPAVGLKNGVMGFPKLGGVLWG